MKEKNNAEFDSFAEGYSAGMENPLKKIIGKNPNEFLKPKIQIILELIESKAIPQKILDFGCGTGEMLALLAQLEIDWNLYGTDVSFEMMKEAKLRHLNLKKKAILMHVDQALDGTKKYDLIYASCVFHHITPIEWISTLKMIASCLEENGRFVIFEHNPWNPITKWVVNHTEIDKNANLFSAITAAALIKKAGMQIEKIRHFMYVPPNMRLSRPADKLLGALPLGGQYFCIAKN